MRILTLIPSILLLALLASCANLRPYNTEPVKSGIESKANKALLELPKPNEKIVAAVYRFRDQTGQYEPSQQSISYSTAVTQGATSILIKAMENSGWFTPIEREGISNLLNERRIIQSTRQQNNDNTPLPPLLFAGIVLEGGIIGYDSNVLTGGAGVRYLGMDVSGQFRKDQVTIYLRAVSTSSGRVLKTVHTTKSILSQKIDAGVFRFIATDELLESEVGVTFNEPGVMAVTEAIDEAVKQLVVEGVDDGLWQPADAQAFTDYKAKYTFAANDNTVDKEQDYYGLTHRPNLRSGYTFTANYSYGSYVGSYNQDEWLYSGAAFQFEKSLTSAFSAKLNYQRSKLGTLNVFSSRIHNIDLLANAYITPDFKLSPYVGLGGGLLAFDKQPVHADEQYYPTVTGEAGFDYRINNYLGLKVGLNYRYFLRSGIDGVTLGDVNDQQWNILTGISYHFNAK